MDKQDAVLLQEAEEHAIAAEVFDVARDVLQREGLADDGPHLDLVFHALVRGVQIGLMDSVLSKKVIGFSLLHKRLAPEAAG